MKMTGIKKAAGESKQLTDYYSGHYLQVNYNKASDEITTNYHYNLGANSWTEYNDPDIITVGNLYEPTTMSEIREMVERRLSEIKRFITAERRKENG